MQTDPASSLTPPSRAARRALPLAALMLAASGLLGAAQAAPPVAQWPRLPRADVPIPPPRPMDLGDEDPEAPEEESPTEAQAPAPPAPRPASPSQAAETAPPGELPALCASLVEAQTIVAERAPPVPVQAGCSLPEPVRISAVRLADGNLATFSPPALLRCEAAVAVAQWMREDIAPAIAALGTRLETIRVADSYQCRTRNRQKGARISEHGQGNAFDTYGFALADGRTLTVKGGGMPLEFQTTMKASACARFTTVLGPGSDGYHEDHIHVDLAVRRLDIRLCRWNIKAPAPPRVAEASQKTGEAAPAAAPAAADGSTVAVEAVPLPPRRPPGLGRAGGG